MTVTYRLIAHDGRLYFPTGGTDGLEKPSLLLHIYDAGDCDSCRWPFENDKDKKILALALYDERETNSTWTTRDIAIIETPDGQQFEWEHLVD